MNRKIYKELLEHIQNTYEQDLSGDLSLESLVDSLDTRVLDTYFGWDQTKGKDGGYWTQQINFVNRNTGKALVDQIKSMGIKKILDVGCGDNEFKRFFGDNLVGIDPYNERADIKVSLENYIAPEDYDIVFALGSINFGDESHIASQVEKIVSFCRPGGMIVIRANPGITHDHPKAKWIDFFEWSEEYINQFALQNNCTVLETGWDHPSEDTIRWGNRYYSKWRKND